MTSLTCVYYTLCTIFNWCDREINGKYNEIKEKNALTHRTLYKINWLRCFFFVAVFLSWCFCFNIVSLVCIKQFIDVQYYSCKTTNWPPQRNKSINVWIAYAFKLIFIVVIVYIPYLWINLFDAVKWSG